MLKSQRESKLSNKSADSLRRLTALYKALCLDCQLTDRDILSLELRATTQGLPFFTSNLPRLGKHFEKCLELGKWEKLSGWDHHSKNGFPLFMNDHFREVFECLDNPSPAAALSVRAIRQVCYFAYKAQTHAGISEFEVASAIKKYKDIEDSIHNDYGWDPTLHLCNLLAEEIFGSFDWDALSSGHGPGTVADQTFTGKFSNPLSPTKISVANYQRFANEDHLIRDSHLVGAFAHSTYFDQQCSEFLCVPKDARGPRTICREPAAAQYAQQGLRRFMQKSLERHRLSKGKVNFEDQSINARLARVHSLTKEYSTIDLSDASDRISCSLVSRIFAGTALGEALFATRSGKVRFPNGETLRLKKFAPMGSAVCFTTLGFVCWALLFSTFCLVDRPDLADGVHVYGDDIVVPSSAHKQAIAILEAYGLKVNSEKSFYKSHFRESCGVDAYNGALVTPVRLRYLLEHEHLSGDDNRWASFASTVHQLWSRGLFQAAINLASLLPTFPPGTEEDSFLSLPEELCGISRREYFVNILGLTPKVDGTGRPYVKAKVYSTFSRHAKVAESEYCFLHRVLLPSIASGRSLDNASSFGVIALPRQTHVKKTTKRVYLD